MDTLMLEPEQLELVKEKYPGCYIRSIRKSQQGFQEYRVVVEGEDEESYYHFLVDNVIAMSSKNFYSRIRSDRAFAYAMKCRINGNSA